MLTGLQWDVLSTLNAGGQLIDEDGLYWLSCPDGSPPARVFPLAFAKLWAAGYIEPDVARPHPQHWILTALGLRALAAESAPVSP